MAPTVRCVRVRVRVMVSVRVRVSVRIGAPGGSGGVRLDEREEVLGQAHVQARALALAARGDVLPEVLVAVEQREAADARQVGAHLRRLVRGSVRFRFRVRVRFRVRISVRGRVRVRVSVRGRVSVRI